ncbi:molybdate ABC transporter substrate-binding protein [Pseudalkalibacillus hwajinpoensis]|uniref:Molybdate ABC transporter substrate-binding protein n=1 Tax=Guptibacillus hwajinpoensis TaxID=208199 RepID=A0A4U1MFV3_9BACL|nr:molybdate ABC transporter substrate-binding protein [Pseudalkalibacillus hwajinpoensis]TKD69262.1 molybdate ABC transporter substrate-binding protein [Pseudalkalibacillus hwajinpoensis]
MRHLLTLFLLLIVISGCGTNEAKQTTLTVAAASSLSDAMKELSAKYEEEHPDTDITLNLASSGVLANQIKQGAPIDVFLSASEDHFTELVKDDLIEPELHTNLLSNKLVLITNEPTSVTGWDDLLSNSIGRIAIGTPETVPAGAYAKEALESMKMIDKLHDQLIFGKDVRQVLTYVETGNADAGIVYKTDYLTSNKVSLVAEAPLDTYSSITYPAGVVEDGREEAQSFFTFLQSEQAMTIFKKYGFQGKK